MGPQGQKTTGFAGFSRYPMDRKQPASLAFRDAIGTENNRLLWFLEVPCGACLLEGRGINKRLTIPLIMPFPQTPMGTSKNQFRWFFEIPCGACLLEGRGINKRLTIQAFMPFPQTPMGTSKNQFRWFFEIPCGACLLEGRGINKRLTIQAFMPFPQTPIPFRIFDGPKGQKITGFAGFSRCPMDRKQPASLVFRGILRGLSIGGKGYKSAAYDIGVHALPPNPHPV